MVKNRKFVVNKSVLMHTLYITFVGRVICSFFYVKFNTLFFLLNLIYNFFIIVHIIRFLLLLHLWLSKFLLIALNLLSFNYIVMQRIILFMRKLLFSDGFLFLFLLNLKVNGNWLFLRIYKKCVNKLPIFVYIKFLALILL